MTVDELRNRLRRHNHWADAARRHRLAERSAVLAAFAGPGTVAGAAGASGGAVATKPIAGTGVWSWAVGAAFVGVGVIVACRSLIATPPVEAPEQPAVAAATQDAPPSVEANEASGTFQVLIRRGGRVSERHVGYFDRARMRVTLLGADVITDEERRMALQIDHNARTATLTKMADKEIAAMRGAMKFGGVVVGAARWALDPASDSHFDSAEARAAGVVRTRIDQRTPEGRRYGVRVSTPGMVTTTLVDPETELPISTVFEYPRRPDLSVEFTGYRFGVAFDPKQLSLDTPEGYRLIDETGGTR